MATTTVEKEFYKFTYEELIAFYGDETLAQAKAEFYIEFLQKYPKISFLKNCPLLRTYQANPK